MREATLDDYLFKINSYNNNYIPGIYYSCKTKQSANFIIGGATVKL